MGLKIIASRSLPHFMKMYQAVQKLLVGDIPQIDRHTLVVYKPTLSFGK
jgi:hypothetical protein